MNDEFNMTAAELFVKCLENEGVTCIFGLPGEENEALLFALESSSIRLIVCRHEQGAAFMADVWGRLTGKAGVCISTLGPGAANLITGVADANLDKAPLVAITAQGGINRLHHESHQLLNVLAMMAPVTKWSSPVHSPDIVPEVVRKAFKLAEMEKPGATHIELSEDIAETQVRESVQPLQRIRVRRPAPNPDALEQALALLKTSQRPLVLSGNGAIRNRASAELRRLVDTFGIPVVSTFMGKGAVSDRRDESLMTMGAGFKDFVAEAVERADLIFAVGYDIAEYAPEHWNPEGNQRIIHVDFSSAEVYRHYAPEVEIIGDIADTLRELRERMACCSYERAWFAPIRKRIVEDLQGYTLSDHDSFTVPGLLNILREEVRDEQRIICDVGAHKVWVARNFPTYIPNGCIISNGMASMGFALPGAIAAHLAEPKHPVIAVMGDGGFLMNVQELETAQRARVHIIVWVFRDDDYGLISWKQRLSRQRSVSTQIGNPDIVLLAESFGAMGYRPENAGEVRSAMQRALNEPGVHIFDLPVDPSANDELTQKLEKHWRCSDEQD